MYIAIYTIHYHGKIKQRGTFWMDNFNDKFRNDLNLNFKNHYDESVFSKSFTDLKKTQKGFEILNMTSHD